MPRGIWCLLRSRGVSGGSLDGRVCEMECIACCHAKLIAGVPGRAVSSFLVESDEGAVKLCISIGSALLSSMSRLRAAVFDIET